MASTTFFFISISESSEEDEIVVDASRVQSFHLSLG